MAPGQYTELFFLDEATALAAGHRPCGTCQKDRYREFKQLWYRANSQYVTNGDSTIQAIDKFLHEERAASAGAQSSWEERLFNLPDGTFVVRRSDPRTVWLYRGERLLRWSPDGYQNQELAIAGETVVVLTPRSIVRTLQVGFRPNIHSSANAGS